LTPTLKSHGIGATLVLTISHPPSRNSINAEICTAAIEAFNAADSNPDVRSIILCGEASYFSCGVEPGLWLAQRREGPRSQIELSDALQGWTEAIHSCSKPVIAAVEGNCSGAGFSLALACDLIVSAANSVFVMAYSSIALSPDGGGSWSLSRLVPRQLATELLMCGERIGAERLHQMGIVNRITEPGYALEQALAWSQQINARAPNALASVKELLSEADGHSLNAQLALERDHFVKNLHHANAGIGIAAFLNKEKPKYI